MVGFDKVSPEELAAVEEMRLGLGDVHTSAEHKDLPTLLRFLRARDHNIKAASEMWRASMRWREQKGVDKLFRDYNAMCAGEAPCDATHLLLRRYMSGLLHGQDKRGGPVFWDRMGAADMGGIIREVGTENTLNWMIAVAEEGVAKYREMWESQDPAQLILHGIIVSDLKGLGLSHLSVAAKYAKLASVLEANYPERMSCVYIVNPPWVFGKIFAIVRPMLNEGTQKKIQVVASKDELLSILQRRVSIDNIPEHLGGKLKWPAHNPLGPVPKGELKRIQAELQSRNHQLDAIPQVVKPAVGQWDGTVSGNDAAPPPVRRKSSLLEVVVASVRERSWSAGGAGESGPHEAAVVQDEAGDRADEANTDSARGAGAEAKRGRDEGREDRAEQGDVEEQEDGEQEEERGGTVEVRLRDYFEARLGGAA